MVAKISPTSPRGSMPSPMRSLSPGRADRPDRRHAAFRRRRRPEGSPRRAAHSTRAKASISRVDADLEEEDGNEQVADGRQLAADALGLLAASEREPGDERADDRCQLRRVGQLRKGQRERERERHQRAGGPRDPLDRARTEVAPAGGRRPRRPRGSRRRSERCPRRSRTTPTPAVTRRTTTVSTTRPMTSSATAAPSTMRASVVAKRPQVAEHPSGDADARRGQRGRHEQRRLEVVADRVPSRRGRGATGMTTPTVATSSDARPTAPSSLQVHLQPDLEQQEDHTDLAERAQDLVASRRRCRAPTDR